MTSIKRQDFVQSLDGKQVDVARAKADPRLSGVAVEKGDLNRDGQVRGAAEASALFSEVDRFDRNGDGNSVAATDAAGNPTTDAAEAIKGMLLPAGGAKGFGLALAVDLLCGGLAGGAIGEAVQPLYGDARVPYDCAHCFIAIDVGHFRDTAAFEAQAAGYAQRLRASKTVAGAAPVRVPGDRARAKRRDAATHCAISREVAAALDELAAAAGLPGRLAY